MKIALIVCSIALGLSLVGCSVAAKFAPSQLDEQGNVIPGSHTLSPDVKPWVDMTGPYGQAAAAIPLLIWNFVELVRAKRSEKGLKATVLALKQASQDPSTKAAFEQIKQYLANSHESAGVTPLIRSLLAKI